MYTAGQLKHAVECAESVMEQANSCSTDQPSAWMVLSEHLDSMTLPERIEAARRHRDSATATTP